MRKFLTPSFDGVKIRLFIFYKVKYRNNENIKFFFVLSGLYFIKYKPLILVM